MKHSDQQSLFSQPGWQALPLTSASVRLWRSWLNGAEADALYERLSRDLQWEQPSLTIAGKTHRIPRLQAWYGDGNAVYRYSDSTFTPTPWTTALADLKNHLEIVCGARFNSVLANWYRDGADGMGFHADNEPELGPQPLIASLSLGGARRFVLKPTRTLDAEPVSLELGNGDLLEMAGQTQHFWRHGLPKTTRPVAARINLTFRLILNQRCRGGEC
jgi:alkylated DNA repair dioxygenase AlkB